MIRASSISESPGRVSLGNYKKKAAAQIRTEHAMVVPRGFQSLPPAALRIRFPWRPVPRQPSGLKPPPPSWCLRRYGGLAGKFPFSPKCLADFASIARDNLMMRTLAVIFVLALITIAFEIYSDAALTSAEVSHTAVPDPATVAVAHGLKQG
jgi:hypothetical protein